ncbi:hypothetical protein, partial [Chitinivorax tropicus]|uniref:hypothetical protein n=1 Tax=Chitinivorax tropicus TaxID=714531 RepID=UPI00161EA8F9
IAIGAIPFIGQAIDLYDTLMSAKAWYDQRNVRGTLLENAQFDMLLALIGWIPGPGDGIKKSLRLVNKDPQRFAPVMFDLLRFILRECGINTSPEALLEQVFNPGYLKAQIAEIKAEVLSSSLFEELPDSAQSGIRLTLNLAENQLPLLAAVVDRRVKSWQRVQFNSAAKGSTGGRAKVPPPEHRSPDTSRQGQERHNQGSSQSSLNTIVAEVDPRTLTNEMVGISGEHIADYYCLETLNWNKRGWQAHDQGHDGRWLEQPSKHYIGKLSHRGALYRLADGPNGTGIDAVWRAERASNDNKLYAVIEAKASRDEDRPKFLDRPNNKRKPGIGGLLRDNARDLLKRRARDLIKDPSELLEPMEDDNSSTNQGTTGVAKPGGGSGKRGSSRRGSSRPTQQGHPSSAPASTTGTQQKTPLPIYVQMSHEWIEKNIKQALPPGNVRDEFLLTSTIIYSRHLFYSPYYHPSGSPKRHMEAKLRRSPPSEHTAHDAFHYTEDEIKKAVNKRKKLLREKHGNLPTLKEER